MLHLHKLTKKIISLQGCRTKRSVETRGFCEMVRNMVKFLRWGLISISPKLQAEGVPLVGCPRLLIGYILSCPPYWKLLLHSQTEEAPCGDGDHSTGKCTDYTIRSLMISTPHHILLFRWPNHVWEERRH